MCASSATLAREYAMDNLSIFFREDSLGIACCLGEILQTLGSGNKEPRIEMFLPSIFAPVYDTDIHAVAVEYLMLACGLD